VQETLKDSSDEALRSFEKGDRTAFARLMEAHLRLVMHITARMVRNPEDQKDLCQEIFLKVYQNLETFRHESKLSTWIAKIAYHSCLNHLQKKRALFMNDAAAPKRSSDPPDMNGLAPDSEFAEWDANERLHREIAQLPVRYRTVLTLYHLDEMSCKEISQIMSLPEGTVKSHLFRARRLLKEKLLKQYRKEELCGQAI
jgi:RNA polymerase sigma-70 factor (ECF subfamily)